MSEFMPHRETPYENAAHERQTPPEMTGRRGFLRFVIHGLGAIFAVVLGAPALLYLIDPRNRTANDTGWTDLARLSELAVDEPREFVIRQSRQDAWTFAPEDIVGRVFLVLKSVERNAQSVPTNVRVEALSTICPHKGCAVNHVPGDPNTPFQCPCHNGTFNIQGEKIAGPMDRGMYTMRVRQKPSNPEVIQIEYKLT